MRIGRRGLQGLGATALAAALGAPAAAQEAGSTWEAIRRRGSVRLGVTQSEPWYAKDVANGGWMGFGVSLGQLLAGDMGAKLELVETSWANAPAGLQAGQFDLMFVLDPTPARALAIDFPFSPVLYYALAFMTKEALDVRQWSELDKPEMTIAVPLGTSMDRWTAAHLPRATITRLATVDEAILHYQSGRSRVLILFHPALIAYRLRIGQGTVVVPKPAVTSVAGCGVRREADKTWRDYLTSVLAFYYENGTIEDLYRGYLAKRGLDPATVPGITKAGLERG